MNTAILILSFVAAATAANIYGYGGYDTGFDKPQNKARERYVNNLNGQRQARVNHIAEWVGASSGTYPRDGVPGTDIRGRFGHSTFLGGFGKGVFSGGSSGYGQSAGIPNYGNAGASSYGVSAYGNMGVSSFGMANYNNQNQGFGKGVQSIYY